jgi:hypothetical protein
MIESGLWYFAHPYSARTAEGSKSDARVWKEDPGEQG